MRLRMHDRRMRMLHSWMRAASGVWKQGNCVADGSATFAAGNDGFVSGSAALLCASAALLTARVAPVVIPGW